MKKFKGLKLFVFFTLIFSLVVAGCGKANDQAEDTEKVDTEKIVEAKEIIVLLPPWGNIPEEMLNQFETKTGIHVNLQTMGWDEIHDKIVTSASAGVAPADVVEFDWSWVGQFGSAGWFEPLNQYLDENFINDIPTLSIFSYNDEYLGVPYSNDFRVTYINKKVFDDAGIKDLPSTPEDLMAAAKAIKAKGEIEYPLGLPLSATEGSATPWYLMTKAFGGELFNKNWEPEFESPDSAGYKAMEFIIKGLTEDKVIDPAAVGLKDVDVINAFKAGKSAIDLAGWSGNISLYKDAEKSTISEQVKMIPVPGAGGKSRNFGLIEAMGIPKASKQKEAAVEFIKWINESENVKKIYLELGLLPNHKSALVELNEEGKLHEGDTLIKVLPTVEPLFPQGTPPWYPDFSIDVATTINQMAKGSMSIEEGIKHITENAKKIAK